MAFKHISKTVSRKYKDKKTHSKLPRFLSQRVILVLYLLDDNKVHANILNPTFI